LNENKKLRRHLRSYFTILHQMNIAPQYNHKLIQYFRTFFLLNSNSPSIVTVMRDDCNCS